MITEIALWWLIVQVLGLIGLPLTGVLFRSLPDGGYAFSKSLGLLLVGYVVWLLAMFGLGSFGVPLIVVAIVLVGGAGIAVQRLAAHDQGATQRIVPPWPMVLGYEAIFLAALVFVAWMRSYDPTPWGTERPMDFALFNAIQHSAAFPPSDPWLAGFSINYYYFGYLLMGVVAQLSGLDPAVAYNLSLALVFALTALGIAGVIVNLVLLTGNKATTAEAPPRRRWAFVPAVVGIVLVLVAGNQAGALQVIVGNKEVVALDGRQLASAVGQAVGGAERIELPSPVQTSDFGTVTELERGDQVANFDWWWPTRALWDDYTTDTGEMRRYNITEFPFFSFRLGDMHPHVMALPFGLLALALGLATLARPVAPLFVRTRSGWIELALVGIVLGSLYVINSWDLPTYVLLFAGALLLLHLRLGRKQGGVRWWQFGQQLGLVALASFVLFLPFSLTFYSQLGAADRLINLPIIGRLTQTIAPFAGSRSGLHAFLVIFGLFAVPLIGFVYLGMRRAAGAVAPSSEALGIVASSTEEHARVAPSSWANLLFGPWIGPLLLLIGLLTGFPLLALFGLGLFAFLQALARADEPAEAFVLLVVALGCAVCFGTELIYIRDVFSNRMNTIFKFYYQVWLLWGTLGAYALWWLLTQAQGARRIGAVVVAGVFVVFLAGSLVYPALVLRQVQSGTQIGLAGRTPRELTDAGRASIEWLRANAAPGSVLVEATEVDRGDGISRGSYNGAGYAGISAATGIPTVLGWPGHEQQWRAGDDTAKAEIGPRKSDVEQIYSTTDAAQARQLLEQYRVDYIYVGGLERQDYAPESLAKFAQIAQAVFSQDEVTIYRFAR